VIRGKCPICGKGFEADSLDAHPSFPFCTPRCRMVDLGRWIDGAYSIPVAPGPGDDDPETAGENPGLASDEDDD
jgi:endogenous inhibitor of DNA gyrase (YacG/DUF329 family)